jgi:hypothetical protein
MFNVINMTFHSVVSSWFPWVHLSCSGFSTCLVSFPIFSRYLWSTYQQFSEPLWQLLIHYRNSAFDIVHSLKCVWYTWRFWCWIYFCLQIIDCLSEFLFIQKVPGFLLTVVTNNVTELFKFFSWYLFPAYKILYKKKAWSFLYWYHWCICWFQIYTWPSQFSCYKISLIWTFIMKCISSTWFVVQT